MRLIKIFSIQLNKLKMIIMWMWIALTTNYIRPGSEVSTATALTPVGSPGRTSRPETVENAEASTINVETANEENSEETVKNVNANKFESTDGVPNPNEVENDRITRTARYYFQPKYN